MKTKKHSHALFSNLNPDAFSLLLEYLTPHDAWRLAQTSTYLYQRVTQNHFWRRYLQKFFPFLRNWHRLMLPDNTSPFQLFSLAYQQHMLSKTKEQRRLIKAIAFDQLPFTASSLIDLKYHFKLKEKHHHAKLKSYHADLKDRHLADEVDENKFSAYCKYHLWQWFMESQCTWTAHKSLDYYTITTPTDRALISEGKIDEFFEVINNFKYYSDNSPASYFTPQLLLLLRLGYTNYIDQIIDFVCKNNFRYSFFFDSFNSCPYLSPLEYCIQYGDYDAFVKCYNIMWNFEPAKLLRPNTLIMMAQSPDPRFLDYVFGFKDENTNAIVDRLQVQLGAAKTHVREFQNKLTLIRKKDPRDLAALRLVWKEIRDYDYDKTVPITTYKKYGELFNEMRQQLYNVFAASIAACYNQKNEKTAKILLKKILKLSSKTTPDLALKKFKLNTNFGKAQLKQYFKSKQALNTDDLYNTAIRLQPSKEQKAFLRKAWKELDGPEQTEGYWHLFFGIVALIIAAILLCAVGALLYLYPNIPLAIPAAIPAIALPIMVASAALLAIGIGIYLLYRSHQLYNPTTESLQTEARSFSFSNNKQNITYPEDTSYDPRFVKNFKSAFDVNNVDWYNKVNLPRFFGDNKMLWHSACNNCNPTSKPSNLDNKMNFNFIM